MNTNLASKEQAKAIKTQTEFFYQKEMLKFQPSIRSESEVSIKHLDAVQASLNYFEVLAKNQGWVIPSTWRNEIQLKLDEELKEILQQMKYEDDDPVDEISNHAPVPSAVDNNNNNLQKTPEVPPTPELFKTQVLKQTEINKSQEILKIPNEHPKSHTILKDKLSFVVNKIPHEKPNETKTAVSDDELKVVVTKSKPKEELKSIPKQMSPEVPQLVPKQVQVFKPTKFVLSNGALQNEKDMEVTALPTQKFQFKTPSAFITMRSYKGSFLTSKPVTNPGIGSNTALDTTPNEKADKA
ncbi:unnamed protein product [Allacma fusca]|uniref:Uncharacterized protein n=1 Tax=Allacma fusca TaxID=39272 RepID=A0A8J2KRX6_9HEXA|nr:unnamed protein product [Allacma fusca]